MIALHPWKVLAKVHEFRRSLDLGLSMAMALLLAIPSAAETLDYKRIHSLYTDSEFDSVIVELEGFKARNRHYSHTDSAFVAKYLAVVYSASPATREKGKFYMYQLLRIKPEDQLLGMYANEEIERMFDRMRSEYNTRPPLDPSGAPAPSRPTEPGMTYSSTPTAPPPPPVPQPPPSTPLQSTSLDTDVEPQRHIALGITTFVAVPSGTFPDHDRKGGMANSGYGMGFELAVPMTRNLDWTTFSGVIYNPIEVKVMLLELAESNQESFSGSGGSWINTPVLTGIRFFHFLTSNMTLFLTGQVGFNMLTATDLKVKSESGINVLLETGYGFAPGFGIGTGIAFGRKWVLGLRYMGFGEPDLTLTATNDMGGKNSSKASVHPALLTAMLGYGF